MKDLSAFSVMVKQPIAWGDMDAYIHVNNVMYFRYFESARIAYFSQIEFNRQRTTQMDIGPILAHTSCNFIQPLTYPDTIEIGAKVIKIGTTSLIMEHAIISPKLGLVATGESVVVCFDFIKNHKTPISPNLKKTIELFEQRQF